MLVSRTGTGLGRPSFKGSNATRPVICAPRLMRPLAVAGNGGENAGGDNSSSKPRRRSSSKTPSSNGDAPPSPAVQITNNMARGTGSGSGSGGSATSPAVQVANNMAAKGSGGSSTPSPAAQVASNLANNKQQQKPDTTATPPAAAGSSIQSPVDLLQQGIRAAADTAESVITNTAAAAAGGIEAAANLSQQGLTATEAAAEDTVRNVNAAAQGTLNAAAAAAGGAAGAVDGVAQSATSSSSGRRSGAGGSSSGGGGGRGSSTASTSSSDFDTVNVRVPSTAWANPTPAKGRIRDATLTQDFDEDEVEQLKVQVLAAVASLDRGLAANVREARDVDRLAKKLEDAAGPVTLKWTTSRSSPNKSTMDKLAGTWRLIYSSGFNGGSLGGSRPGPPAAFVPTILGQVYQVINAQAMTLDNVVELLLNYGLPQLPFLPRPEPQATPGLRLTLHHTYEVTPPCTVKIVFESTAAKAIGPDLLQSLPELGVPELPAFLKPPKDFRSATFEVTYLDQSMRITRGDRGELRIYLRDRPLTPSLPMDDSDRDYE